MAASHDLKSRVTDLATCPICLELFDKPKSLPCLHTFCLECLRSHFKDQLTGDEVPCPLCRREFKIPSNGLSGLLSNFFIESLVDARKTSVDLAAGVPCEVCLADAEDDAKPVPRSTTYCVDCHQKLCEACSRPHRRMKGGPHELVTLGSEAEVETGKRRRAGKCAKHGDDDIRLYCFDCKTNICMMCFAEEHQQHKCKNVATVAEECVKQIDADLKPVTARADSVREQLATLGEGKRRFLDSVREAERQIRESGDEMKQAVDRRVYELLSEVKATSVISCKEVESQKDKLEKALLALESFSAYSSELKSKGNLSDITRAAEELHARATDVLKTDEGVFCWPSVTFLPVKLTGEMQNFIGQIRTKPLSGKSKPTYFV